MQNHNLCACTLTHFIWRWNCWYCNIFFTVPHFMVLHFAFHHLRITYLETSWFFFFNVHLQTIHSFCLIFSCTSLYLVLVKYCSIFPSKYSWLFSSFHVITQNCTKRCTTIPHCPKRRKVSTKRRTSSSLIVFEKRLSDIQDIFTDCSISSVFFCF